MIDQELIDRLAKMVGISERLCDGSPSERWTAVGIDDMNEVLAALTAAKRYADEMAFACDGQRAAGALVIHGEMEEMLLSAFTDHMLAHFGGAQ